MKDLHLVSNRLPISVQKKDGKLTFKRSIGGLAIGLGSYHESRKCVWYGWPGIETESITQNEKKKITDYLLKNQCKPVFINSEDIEMFYEGFCNKTIWPLFHYFSHMTEYNRNFWIAYEKVNELFCKVVLNNIGSDDYIWVHDYHFMLLPEMIRMQRPEIKIGFFLHIPFPSFELFRLLPWRSEILKGLLGADLVGFHTYEYIRHFSNSVRRILGYENTMGKLLYENRIVQTDVFPMGIDFDKFEHSKDSKRVKNEIKKIKRYTGDKRIIISIDRLDYTKGILERLQSFNFFLKKYPEYQNMVTLILIESPSRTGVDTYMKLKSDVDQSIGEINGKYGTIGWVPIWNIYKTQKFDTLFALYNLADVALVTPLRDGMNLVAKEYIASNMNGKGVLILSEMAGAAMELSEAIIVNPNNFHEVADAIKNALEMDKNEQTNRLRQMAQRLSRYTVVKWAGDFIERLKQVEQFQEDLKANRLTSDIKSDIIKKYKKSRRRLFLLDYDGSLVSFKDRPEKAFPEERTLGILKKLADDTKNTVVIISGRDRNSLSKFFKDLPVCLSAEHGVWIKMAKKRWQKTYELSDSWKDEFRHILEFYVDRTPGSFLEEKDYSLVWHYRKVYPELAMERQLKLKDQLIHLATGLNLTVFEGKKNLEVKNSEMNKGSVANIILKNESWDFILSVGDDVTDEDLFSVLPSEAFSIKVGQGPSKARFNLNSVYEVQNLLEKLAKAGL